MILLLINFIGEENKQKFLKITQKIYIWMTGSYRWQKNTKIVGSIDAILLLLLTTEMCCWEVKLFRGFRAVWSTIMLRLAFSDEKMLLFFCFAFLLYSNFFLYVDSFTMNIQKMICVWIFFSAFLMCILILNTPRRCRGTGSVFYYYIYTSLCINIAVLFLFIFAHLQQTLV